MPGVIGIPGVGGGFGGYSCKPASGPHGCWGPWSQQVSFLSLWTPATSIERQWAPSPLGKPQRETTALPTTMILAALKQDEQTLQVVPLPSGPLRP